MADIRSLEGYLGITCITLVLWNLFHYVMCRSSLGQTATRIFALTILKETHEIKGWGRSNQFLLVSKWASWVHNPCTLEIRHWVCATYINRDHCYFRPFGKRLKLTKPNLKIYSYNPDYFLLMKANRSLNLNLCLHCILGQTQSKVRRCSSPQFFLLRWHFNLFVCTTPGSCQH